MGVGTIDSRIDPSAAARGRLAVLAAHLTADRCYGGLPQVLERSPTLAIDAAGKPGNLGGSLTVVDERTGKKYVIQVSPEGTVKATDFKKCMVICHLKANWQIGSLLFLSILLFHKASLISYKQCHTMPIPWAFLSVHWCPFSLPIQMQTLLLGVKICITQSKSGISKYCEYLERWTCSISAAVTC
ncbi:uncharacterized protein LOC141815886 isoform X2 [Curcuma longa]|uniref:uncharacterized protein LOC141815886 isoform X2 n=1 Tax=Curcuma longa TaxID=136217 RepID=UPI003D9ED2EF